ncbi:MAG: tyrosine-type recombinase/integrase [Epsilonproteobacteria bacterium]|nr:tyrosine-type recombinase/integrase [Campylobacterota bacterium]
MARNTKSISNAQIKSLKPTAKEFCLYDGGGLQLTVKKSGSKVFEFRYKSPATGKYQKITLGKYPILSLVEARDKRFDLQKQLFEGIDPKFKKDDNIKKIKDIVLEFKTFMKGDLAPTTYKRNCGVIDRDILRYFGESDIRDITRFEMAQFLMDVNSRGVNYTVKLAHNLCKRIWRYSMALGYVDHNIPNDVDREAIIPRIAVKNLAHTTSPKELKRLLCDIVGANITPVVKLSLFFIAHTFLRPYNVRFLRWDEINFTKNMITIEFGKMKTRRAHLVPLSKEVLEILKKAKVLNGDKEYVFETNRGKNMSDATMNRALERLGYKGRQTAHGFRHTASTILHENIYIHGVISDAIERQLAHVEGGTAGVYNKAEYITERIKLMHWWSAFLYTLCTY